MESAKVRAIVKNKKIVCGRCLNVLDNITFDVRARNGAGNIRNIVLILETKCKARKNSVNCDTINIIEL